MKILNLLAIFTAVFVTSTALASAPCQYANNTTRFSNTKATTDVIAKNNSSAKTRK